MNFENVPYNLHWIHPHGKPRVPDGLRRYVHDEDLLKEFPDTGDMVNFLHIDYSRNVDFIVLSYQHLCKNRGFAKRIPFCLFQYYCNFLLWRRMSFVTSMVYDKDRFKGPRLCYCQPREVPVPNCLFQYLAGLGEVVDP